MKARPVSLLVLGLLMSALSVNAKVPPLSGVPDFLPDDVRTDLNGQRSDLEKQITSLREWAERFNAKYGNRKLNKDDPLAKESLDEKARLMKAGEDYARAALAFDERVYQATVLRQTKAGTEAGGVKASAHAGNPESQPASGQQEASVILGGENITADVASNVRLESSTISGRILSETENRVPSSERPYDGSDFGAVAARFSTTSSLVAYRSSVTTNWDQVAAELHDEKNRPAHAQNSQSYLPLRDAEHYAVAAALSSDMFGQTPFARAANASIAEMMVVGYYPYKAISNIGGSIGVPRVSVSYNGNTYSYFGDTFAKSPPDIFEVYWGSLGVIEGAKAPRIK